MIKVSRKYVFEIDGVMYSHSEGKLDQIADLKQVEGNQWLITDLREAISKPFEWGLKPNISGSSALSMAEK